ncbi:hypothetical protein [Bacillus sp. SG-1]|uniref:hypothetical protein n=1 Tax=Bacillus sp. SG-1 TaxID=161544 RepID=UPI0001543FDA|nr:hypothetical protein [Bacillus sp. SG-1]EDL65009.1 hypothetical protein BSG1_14849 [Bacillus sp. SG-1]
MALSTMAKTFIATGLAGGIAVTGIVWTGGESVNKIKGNLDNMKQEVTEAVQDNEFLKGQFDSLKNLYSSSVQEANATIDSLTQERNQLLNQVDQLQSDLAAQDGTQEQAEIQAEIDRLESELDKANQQIAELETYAQQADDAATYTAIDQTQYTVDGQAVVDPTIRISEEATAFNSANAEILANENTVKTIEAEFAEKGVTVNIKRVVKFNYMGTDLLAYEVEGDFSALTLGERTSTTYTTAEAIGERGINFVNANGERVHYASNI